MKNYFRYSIVSITVVIVILTYVFVNYLFTNNNFFNGFINVNKSFDNIFPVTEENDALSNPLDKKAAIKPVAEKDKKYVCGDGRANSNDFITEFVLPFPCSQPVGLTVDNSNNIWIAANWIGRFLVFDPSTKTFIKNISIPNWNPKTMFGSMIWDLKFDKNGDLWFTDEQSSSIWKYLVKQDKFEKYISPTDSSYPLSLTFDPDGNVWFTNVFGKKLAVLDPDEVKNNTTKGIREIDLGKSINFETMGPSSMGLSHNRGNESNGSILGDTPGNLGVRVASDDTGKKDDIDTMWLSTVESPYGGQIVRFNMKTQTFTVLI
ncbi:MAG TPA: hypothetical protein VFG45_05285 [Candidatus Nitrosocosmicus sp.]|nr:hypothetical protein [Candidatus Nitrosocosmicus sp.]